MSLRLQKGICIFYIMCAVAFSLFTNITRAQEGDFEISLALETPFGKKNITGTMQLSNAHMPWFERTEKSKPWYFDAAVMAFKCVKLYRKYKQFKRAERIFTSKYKEWTKDQFITHACIQHMDFAACSRPEIQHKIMAEYHLYQFPGFQELIRTFPLYQEYVIELYNRLALDNEFRAHTQQLPGYRSSSFYEVVIEMLKEILVAQYTVVKTKKSREIQDVCLSAPTESRFARLMCTLKKIQNFSCSG